MPNPHRAVKRALPLRERPPRPLRAGAPLTAAYASGTDAVMSAVLCTGLPDTAHAVSSSA